MKKTFCLLMVLVLILSAGCAKKDDSLTGTNGIIENPVDSPALDEQEEIGVPEVEQEETAAPEVNAEEPDETKAENKENATPEPEAEEIIKTCEQFLTEISPPLMEYLKDKQYIVVQAKKVGESTIVADHTIIFPYAGTTRMQLEITKVYHGDLQPGDRINYWEVIGDYWVSEDSRDGFRINGLEAICDDTEYLMILEGDVVYDEQIYRILLPLNPTTGYLSGYSYVPINEREAIAQRIQDGTADKYDQFRHALFEGLAE